MLDNISSSLTFKIRAYDLWQCGDYLTLEFATPSVNTSLAIQYRYH